MKFFKISAQSRTNLSRATMGTVLVFVGLVSGAWIGLDRLNQLSGMSAMTSEIRLDSVSDFVLSKTGTDVRPTIEKCQSWIIDSVSMIDSKPIALGFLLGGCVVAAIGFVLCGAAGGGLWVLICPIGALLGLPGWPLRHGRCGRLVRSVYVLVGIGLIATGLYAMLGTAKTGTAEAIRPIQWLAFAELTLGLAAILGVVLRVRQMRLSIDSLQSIAKNGSITPFTTTRGKSGEATLVMPPALLAAIQSRTSALRRYVDPPLSVSLEMETVAEIESVTKVLETKGFDNPLLIEIMRPAFRVDATIQIGCRNMVMAMTEFDEDVVRLRLTSVLEDGHLVISIVEGDHGMQKAISTDAVSVRVDPVKNLASMLSPHLEATGVIAQQRSCGLVAIESLEWRDLLHASERSLANAAHISGYEKWEIPAATYGRFSYPPKPVRTLLEA